MSSGDTLLAFTALQGEPPDADAAALSMILVASSDEPDDMVPVWAFDDGATNENIEFAGVMPRHYGGGGLTVTLIWSSGQTTGVARWEIAFKSFTDDADDLDSKAYAAANAVNATTASAAGELAYDTITFTDGADMDSVAAGEYFRMRVNRDSADTGNDTLTGDAELVAIEIQET